MALTEEEITLIYKQIEAYKNMMSYIAEQIRALENQLGLTKEEECMKIPKHLER